MTVTVGDLVRQLCQRFDDAGLTFGHGYDSAWDEAVALVLAVTGLPDDRSVLAAALDPAALTRIDNLARRRIDERIPLAHLIGRSIFAGHSFLVEPGIVVPRSPIGPMIEDRFSPWLTRTPRRILDLCCGSGCIGIAAALVFPEARVDLADVDPAAVDLARRNAARLGVDSRVEVHRSDLFEQLPPGRWDLIVSNPPYVDRADMAALPAEYRHEPAHGLAGGDDGLDLVARMLDELPVRLAPGGTFVCEVGASVPALYRRYPRTAFLWPELPQGGEGVFVLSDEAAGIVDAEARP